MCEYFCKADWEKNPLFCFPNREEFASWQEKNPSKSVPLMPTALVVRVVPKNKMKEKQFCAWECCMLGESRIRECACHLWTSESGEKTQKKKKKRSWFSPPPFTALFWAGLSHFWQDSPSRLSAEFIREKERDLMHVKLPFENLSSSDFRHNEINYPTLSLSEDGLTSDLHCRLIFFTKRNTLFLFFLLLPTARSCSETQ